MTWGEILTAREAEYCQALLTELEGVDWARSLLARVRSAGLSYESKPLLFELRFAAEIHHRGLSATYEHPTGVGNDTVDFRIEHDGTDWLIELVSILPSDAVRRATRHYGLFFETHLSSDAQDPRESEEGELILVQQKIGAKVFDGNRPIKFPRPHPPTYTVILVDMRGYGVTGGDLWDYREIAYGPFGIPDHLQHFRHHWTDATGAVAPIRSLFDPANDRQRASPILRDRVHFLGFTADERYQPASLADGAHYLSNPHLFAEHGSSLSAFQRYPLRPRPAQPASESAFEA
jgi:hypothetical protein